MPPRLLISATASSTLLVEIGPQIPGEPEKVRKLPTRNLLRAPLPLENPELRERSEGWVAVVDRFLSSMCRGIGGPLGPAELAVESTPTPLLRYFGVHRLQPAPLRYPRRQGNILFENIET